MAPPAPCRMTSARPRPPRITRVLQPRIAIFEVVGSAMDSLTVQSICRQGGVQYHRSGLKPRPRRLEEGGLPLRSAATRATRAPNAHIAGRRGASDRADTSTRDRL